MEDGSLPEGEVPSVLEVAVAMIEQEGRVLITQRLPTDSFGGHWEFPGGKVNPGETLEACLAREIQEELGIAIAVGAKALVVEHPYPHRTIRLHCFSCRLLSGEPQTIECAAWRWVLPQELSDFSFPPASAPMIELLRRKGVGAP